MEVEYDLAGRPQAYYLKSRQNGEKLQLRSDLRYDAEGFLLSYRDAQNEVYIFISDGFGREWKARRPDGLESATIRDGLDRVICQRQRDATGKLLATCETHQVILQDDRGQAWCTLPIGHDGAVDRKRAVLTQYDNEGRQVLELLSGVHRKLAFYNTLSLLEKERVEEDDAIRPETLSHTINFYAADGLLPRIRIVVPVFLFS